MDLGAAADDSDASSIDPYVRRARSAAAQRPPVPPTSSSSAGGRGRTAFFRRPSAPELQPRAPLAQVEESGGGLSRMASEGTFRASEGEREEGALPPSMRTTAVAFGGSSDGTVADDEGEGMGSLHGMGRAVLASTPPPPVPPPQEQEKVIPAARPRSASAPPIPVEGTKPAVPSRSTQPPPPPAQQPLPLSPSASSPPSPVIPHLPPLSPGSTSLTALQNWDVAPELEFSVAKMVGAQVLDEVLKDQEALKRLREFIDGREGSDPLLLDLYNDLKVFSDLATHLRLSSAAILSTYLLKTSPSRLVLPISIRGPVLSALTESSSAGLTLLPALHELLTRLYEREFKPFLQERLVQQAVSRLGSWKAGCGWTGASERAPDMVGDGLADCYCLTNPRLRDNPIVLASQGFSQLTGYPLEAIVGRNCRFLQGPGTAPDSTLRLREALNAGEGITSLLLNYRLDGSPFYNLLCMLPLRAENGTVKFFLGGQIDVTGAIASFSHLARPDQPTQAQPNGDVPAVNSGDDTAHFPHGGQAHYTSRVQAHTDRLLAASEKSGPMSVAGLQELAQALPPPKVDDVKGNKWAVNGDQEQEEEDTVSDSTVSIRQPSPTAPSHHRRAGSTTSLDSATASAPTAPRPARTRSSSLSSRASNGGGIREAAEAIKDFAVGGARRIRRMGSKESAGDIGLTREEMGKLEGKRAAREKEAGRKRVGPLVAQLKHFEATYSRVVLFRQSNGEILFCTPELVAYCGLPPSTQFSLAGTEFASHLCSPSSSNSPTEPEQPATEGVAAESPVSTPSELTRRLRRNVRLAIENGHSWTGLVAVRLQGKGKLFGKAKQNEAKEAVLHLTPLCDSEGQCEAFVAVFG
ncbi:hypothetical protein JCM10207_003870 [Rhodosporidiobolus poonsookiae]